MSLSSFSDRHLRRGEILFPQGVAGLSAFLLKEGNIEISIDRDGERSVVAQVGPGELIGEMAIVDGSCRSANAIALTDCTLFEFTREQFERRLGSADPIVKLVLAVVLKRMRRMLGTDSVAYPPIAALTQSEANSDHALTQLALERDLADALETNALTLFYQPIIDLQSGRFAGLEALVRWHHPTRGLLMPAQFIPLAEATGLITDLTRWAIREVCTRLPDFQIVALSAYPAAGPLFVSVNVSAGDLVSEGFSDEVEAMIKLSGIDPSWLKLEITESTLMDDLEHSIDVLHRFRNLGVTISIDDFGTGYSSLASLGRLPLDTLKIDRAFVTPLDTDISSHRLIQAITQLAGLMQFDTVAEGIETAEQRDTVRDLGGRFGQGYLFGRPVSLESTYAVIRSWDPAPHSNSRPADVLEKKPVKSTRTA